MSQDNFAGGLGELERQVFDAVQELGASSVAGVVAHLASRDRALAYTTIMTVLTRLWEKGFLLRQRQGKAYIYVARESNELADHLASRAAREALERFGQHALTGFVRTLSAEQRVELARLLQADRPDSEGATSDVI